MNPFEAVLQAYRRWEAEDRRRHPDNWPMPVSMRETEEGRPRPRLCWDCLSLSDYEVLGKAFQHRLVASATPNESLVPVLDHVLHQMSRAFPGREIPRERVYAEVERLLQVCEREGQDPFSYQIVQSASGEYEWA